MKFIRHVNIVCLTLASGFTSMALHAQAPQAPQTAQAKTLTAIIGQWNFETAIGTTRTGDKEIDIIGKGIMQIRQKEQTDRKSVV